MLLVQAISCVPELSYAQSLEEHSHRLIVLTDIKADPDDSQSLVRWGFSIPMLRME